MAIRRSFGKVRNQYITKGGKCIARENHRQESVDAAQGHHECHCPAEYFDVQTKNGQIVLTPVRIQRADAMRAKLAELDLKEGDIADAVEWARRPVRKTRK